MDLKEHIEILQRKAVCNGLMYEPRILFDQFDFDGTNQIAFSHPDVFVNTERWPLHITHMLSSMLYHDDQDERLIQRYGLRFVGHDTYYINPGAPDYPLIPLYHNVVSAASDIVTMSQSTWDFMYPVEMGRRDVFQVEVQLIVASVTPSRIAVTFHGLGMLSRQPKLLSGYIDLTDTSPGVIDTDFYRNDGLEPLFITKVTANIQPPAGQSDPTGNIRNVRLRIKQNGNGTQQWWSRGPIITSPNDRAPEPLWGVTTGRAVVHKIPGGGWRWASGEGVNAQVQAFNTQLAESVLVGLIGYVEVT